MQPRKIQDLSIQISDVLLNGQQEQEEVKQPQKQKQPEKQQQQEHRNWIQSKIEQEQHTLNREHSSPHLSDPQQNDAEIEKMKIITQTDIKNQHKKSDNESFILRCYCSTKICEQSEKGQTYQILKSR